VLVLRGLKAWSVCGHGCGCHVEIQVKCRPSCVSCAEKSGIVGNVTLLFCRLSMPFMEAVDWEGQKLLEYPFIVSMPMDLTTLEKRLCDGFYKKSDAFARDARLVFTNVLSFNSPEDQVSV